MFLARVEEKGDAPFLWAKTGAAWEAISWNEAARRVAALAESLLELGLQPGDRVILVSENRPEWLIADLAIMAAGCVTVPTYTTNTSRDHTHILTNSGAKAAIVSTQKLAKTLIPAVLFGTDCRHVIGIEDLRTGQVPEQVSFHHWDEMTAGSPDLAALKSRVAGIHRSDMACIIYTSGTGGAPRGVMQHHGSILHNIEGAGEVISTDFGWGDEVFLSFLPASHAYEHTAGQHFPIGLRAQIYYAESLEKLASNIEEVKPTIMAVVPRLFEMLRARIIKSVEKSGGASEYLLRRALEIGTRANRGERRLADLPMEAILSLTLRRKVHARFGGRIKAMVSGGAPLNPEIG
ncbi:MAG: AMP-binding protein, partial [Sphingomicrobium sp.]